MTVARAKSTEVFVASYAWYWESQQSQAVTDPTSGADVVTIEAANPFCPTTPAGGLPQETESCKPGRLPVEVAANDYETPEMISAVAFDLSLVPLGSEVSKFEVTFIEANDDQSQPLNPEGKELKACLVEEFFGDGEARQYKEAPRFTCSDLDPVAKRKEVKYAPPEGEKEDRFAWTFDMTSYAQSWLSLESTNPASAIMLYPVEPKEADPSTDANWRVVLVGPAEEGAIQTKVVYNPPALPEFDTDTDVSSGDFTPPTSGSDSFTTPGSFGAPPSGTTSVPSAAPAPVDVAAPAENTSDVLPAAGGLPGYAWLALLVGLLAFSLFRQVVLETAIGHRPDGVLAQIRKINADRRGTTLEAIFEKSPSRFAPIVAGLRGLRGGASGVLHKLPFVRRKG
jgi:hypothetical protein